MTPPSHPGGAAPLGAPAPVSAGLQPNLRGHMPALDGVRGLAVLMVLVFHFVGNTLPTSGVERAIIGVTSYGAYGVELFFVLSGFLITGILYDAHNKPHYFRNFYMRRLLRIFPL
jgi:peptidoglycan/LPS O-acetylase OafA/YrhL